MDNTESILIIVEKSLKKLWEQKAIRFFVVGCFNTLMDITLLLIFFKIIGIPELVANSLSVALAVSVSYFLNHKVVFRYQKKYSLKNYLRFLVVTGFSVIIIQDIIIYLVTHKLWVITNTASVVVLKHLIFLKTIELLSAKIAAVLIGMVWNFFLYKYIIFRHQDPPDKAEELVLV